MAVRTVPVQRNRLTQLDVRALARQPVLIFNPHAGQKLGIATNTAGADAVKAALSAVGIEYEARPTQYPRHAVSLARQAVEDGHRLVIAGGGDGTVAEVAEGIAGTEAVLGIMPLGSIMNMARTLCIPRDLMAAGRVITQGNVLAMDAGEVNGVHFLEAGGVGLAAGLFGYFDRLERGARLVNVLRGATHFLRNLGAPRLILNADGEHLEVRAPMLTVSNGPFVGAAYAIAPQAQIDDGLLDVTVFQRMSIPRLFLHLALVAGGRRLPPPPEARVMRVRDLRVALYRRRSLPVHADGATVAATPAHFRVLPAALNVLVGGATSDAPCAWEPRGDSAPTG